MQIELSKSDVKVLKEALDAWERDASSSMLFGGMLSAMLTPKEERDNERQRLKEERNKAEQEQASRRDRATLIRAALIRAEIAISEHEEVERA